MTLILGLTSGGLIESYLRAYRSLDTPFWIHALRGYPSQSWQNNGGLCSLKDKTEGLWTEEFWVYLKAGYVSRNGNNFKTCELNSDFTTLLFLLSPQILQSHKMHPIEGDWRNVLCEIWPNVYKGAGEEVSLSEA